MIEVAGPPRSPVAVALGPLADALPEVFRRQFLVGAPQGAAVLLEGEMSRIWHRPRWLQPLLRVLSRAQIAVPEAGTDIPARVVIRSTPGRTSTAVHLWERAFRLHRVTRFRSRLAFDHHRAELIEWLGHPALFGIVWGLRLGPGDRMVMRTDRYRLSLGGRTVAVPRTLSRSLPATVEFEQAAVAPDRFGMRARVVHPLLGPVFGYEGRFTVRLIEGSRRDAI